VLNSYFRQRDSLEPVSRKGKELSRRMRDGLVTVIDTCPQAEFEAGHLPGAINVPLSELSHRRVNCLAIRKSSPIAVAPTAFFLTRP
jgi:rhodanese-related sulfurtransferase